MIDLFYRIPKKQSRKNSDKTGKDTQKKRNEEEKIVRVDRTNTDMLWYFCVWMR